MIGIEKQDYPLAEGLTLALRVAKGTKLAELMGIRQSNLSGYASGRFLPTGSRLEGMNDGLQNIGEALMSVRMTRENWKEVYEQLREFIKLTPMLKDECGLDRVWVAHHITSTRDRYYGQFTDEELRKINEAVMRIALRLLQIHLVLPMQENTPESTETTTQVQG